MRAGCRILQYCVRQFGPNPASVPVVNVPLVSLCAFDELAAFYTVKTNFQFGGCGMSGPIQSLDKTKGNSVGAAGRTFAQRVRLPGIKMRWAKLAEQSDWLARLLAA